MKRLIGVLLCCAVVLGAVGCDKKSDVQKSDNSKKYNGMDISEHVDLTMYLIGTKPDDMDKVLEKFNEKLNNDLNATLGIEWIGWGDFAKEYPILLTSGETVDLIYSGSWLNFYENAQRGAFLELDDILSKYAPESFGNMSEADIKDVSVNGHIYAVPADYTNFNAFGPMIRSDYLEEYNISSIDSFQDYINLCVEIGTNDSIDPTGLCSSSIELDDLYLLSEGYYPLSGSTGSLYWVDLEDPDKTVYFASECPKMDYFLKNAAKWYKQGCWSKDALYSKDETMLESGKAASRVHNYDAWLGESGKDNDYELLYFNLAKPLYKQTASQDCMSIPKSSKHPERALMLLEKLKNDESYYMLLTYGIEGYNYEKDGDTKINFLNDTYGNEPGTWGFRNAKFYKQNTAVSDEAIKEREEYVASAEENPMPGFHMILSEMETKYDQIAYISKLYYDPLVLGYVDYDEGKKLLNDNLTSEGNAEIKKLLQKQVDDYFSE